MQNVFPSFIIGFLYTLALFILCLISVVGTRSLFFSLNNYLKEKLVKKPPPCPEPIKKSVRKRKPKQTSNSVNAVTSIEIDPDKIDRIYVKKIS